MLSIEVHGENMTRQYLLQNPMLPMLEVHQQQLPPLLVQLQQAPPTGLMSSGHAHLRSGKPRERREQTWPFHCEGERKEF